VETHWYEQQINDVIDTTLHILEILGIEHNFRLDEIGIVRQLTFE
jgi:hypothetical protein